LHLDTLSILHSLQTVRSSVNICVTYHHYTVKQAQILCYVDMHQNKMIITLNTHMALHVPFQEIFQLVPTEELYFSMPVSTAGLSIRDSPDTRHESYPLEYNTC
jgi:hypothetical protein